MKMKMKMKTNKNQDDTLTQSQSDSDAANNALLAKFVHLISCSQQIRPDMVDDVRLLFE